MWELVHKKTECQRIDALELWCWRRLLRVHWTARSNQSILKEINPGYSLEGLMRKLKLQYFGQLMRRAHCRRPWWWEILRAGGEGWDRGWDGWMASLIRWTWVWAGSRNWCWTEKTGVMQSVYKEINSVPKHKLVQQPFTLRGQVPTHPGLFPDQVHSGSVTSVSSCQFPYSLSLFHSIPTFFYYISNIVYNIFVFFLFWNRG